MEGAISAMNQAIYYPNFEPPRAWLRRCLLIYDCLCTIVPNESKKELSCDFIETANQLSGDLRTIEPNDNYVKADDFRIERLDKIFAWISHDRAKPSVTRTAEIEPDGKMAFTNVSFMHDAKLSSEILSLLKKHSLIGKELDDLADKAKPRNYHAVDERACHVILSHIADRMSRREGFSLLSDEQLGIATTTLNAFEPTNTETATRILANALIRVGVPAEIDAIPLNEFVELRKHYTALREPFHTALFHITHSTGLARIEHPDDLVARVREIASEFESSIAALRNKRPMQKFKNWLPFCINSISQLSALIITNPASLFAFASANISLVLSGELSRDEGWKSPVKETQRIFASVQESVFNKALLETIR